MQVDLNVIRVLSVNRAVDGGYEEIVVTQVDTELDTLVALRNQKFDLMLTSCEVDGVAVWPLAQKVRLIRPKLHWWLISPELTQQHEILARSLGVTRILEQAPEIELIRTSIKRRPIRARAPNAPPPIVSVGKSI